MWILVIAKLPTEPSPPKLSIHWSREDGRSSIAKKQRERLKEQQAADYWEAPLTSPGKQRRRGKRLGVEGGAEEELALREDALYFDHGLWNGKEPNYIKARSIAYKGATLRLFPHEYKILSPESMRGYIFGLMGEEIPSHELVPLTEADAHILGQIKEEDQRMIYDAALMDGCIHEQALLTALGVDLFASGAEIAPIGWYRCKEEYASMFCHPWEMVE